MICSIGEIDLGYFFPLPITFAEPNVLDWMPISSYLSPSQLATGTSNDTNATTVLVQKRIRKHYLS